MRPVKVKHESKLETIGLRTMRWIYGVSLRDKIPSTELTVSIGVEPSVEVYRRNGLRWCGHVKRKADDEWLKRCTRIEEEGSRPRGRPRKTWMKTPEDDMRCALLPADRRTQVCGEGGSMMRTGQPM
jgi:hypothetical protein